MRDLDYYPASYDKSRKRFIDMTTDLHELSPHLQQLKIPSERDEDLSIDVCYFPAKEQCSNLLVLTSGVHGIEGFTGAAIQTMFLKEYIKRIHGSHTGVLLVHAVNPFGFKHFRRTTENNVNLNRNFWPNEEIFGIKNDGYMNLKNMLAPEHAISSTGFKLASLFSTIMFKLLTKQATMKELTQAIASGQYQFEEGIEYGGRGFEPQVEILGGLFKEVYEKYRRIIHLDLHTGLGEPNFLHVITGPSTDRHNFLLDSIFQAGHEKGTWQLVTGDTKGFYHVKGDLPEFSIKHMPRPKESLAVTMEFGTLGGGLLAKIDTLHRLILENQGFYHGYNTPEVRSKVREGFKELFYPSSPVWRKAVLNICREVFDQTAKSLSLE